MYSKWLGLVGIVFTIASSCAFSTTVTGHPHVVDADTIIINGTRIRLAFLDAPESRQQCLKASGESYACGNDATDALRQHIHNQRVSCTFTKKGRYGRALGMCRTPSTLLNQWLVSQGYAVAAYGRQYYHEESLARQRRLGLWQGSFLRPAEWRCRQRDVCSSRKIY